MDESIRKEIWNTKDNSEVFHLFIALILSSLSLFVYNTGQLFIVNIISVIYVAIAIFRPMEKSLLYIVLALSNTVVFSIAGVSTSLCICCAYIVKLVFLGKKTTSGKFVIICFLYLFIGSIVYYLYNDLTYGIIMPIKNVLMLMYLYLYSRYIRKQEDVKKQLYEITVWGSSGILFNVLSSLLIQHSMKRIAVLNNDSNILAIEAAVYISLTLILYYKFDYLNIFKTTYLMVSMCIVLLLAGSRSGLIILAFIFLFTIMCNLKKIGKMFWLFLLIFILLLFVLFSNAGRNAYLTLLNRMNSYDQMGDMSNGRFDIWRQYINTFNKSAINWMVGLGNYSNVNIQHMAHNGLLEDISCNGIIGLFLYFSIFCMSIKNIKARFKAEKQSKKDLYLLMPIFVIFIGTLTLRGIINIINSTLLFISCYLLYFSKHEQKLLCG